MKRIVSYLLCIGLLLSMSTIVISDGHAYSNSKEQDCSDFSGEIFLSAEEKYTGYKDTLDNIYNEICEGTYQLSEYNRDDGELSNVGFQLIDIDGNGIYELIIGSSNYPNKLMHLYTIFENEVVEIASSDVRFGYYLTNDDKIYFFGSIGAAWNYNYIYELSGKDFILQQAFWSEDDDYGVLFYYGDESNYHDNFIRGQYDGNDLKSASTTSSQADYESLFQYYYWSAKKELDLTFFDSYEIEASSYMTESENELIEEYVDFLSSGGKYDQAINRTLAKRIAQGIRSPFSAFGDLSYTILNGAYNTLKGNPWNHNPYEAIISVLVIQQINLQNNEYENEVQSEINSGISIIFDAVSAFDPFESVDKDFLEQMIRWPTVAKANDPTLYQYYSDILNDISKNANDTLEGICTYHAVTEKLDFLGPAIDTAFDYIAYYSELINYNAQVAAFTKTSTQFKKALMSISAEMRKNANSSNDFEDYLYSQNFHEAMMRLFDSLKEKTIVECIFEGIEQTGKIYVKGFSDLLVSVVCKCIEKSSTQTWMPYLYPAIKAYETGWQLSELIIDNGSVSDCREFAEAFYHMENAVIKCAETARLSFLSDNKIENALLFDTYYNILCYLEREAISNYINLLEINENNIANRAFHGISRAIRGRNKDWSFLAFYNEPEILALFKELDYWDSESRVPHSALSSAETAPVQPVNDGVLSAVYAKYLAILEEKRDAIRLFGNYPADQISNADAKPVALRDINNDGIPELFFLTQQGEAMIGRQVAVEIWTWRLGDVCRCYLENGFGTYYSSFQFYQVPNDSSLFFRTYGGDALYQGEIKRLLLNENGEIVQTGQLDWTEGYWNPDTSQFTDSINFVSASLDGIQITEDVWREKYRQFADVETLFLTDYVSPDSAFLNSPSYIALSFDEAVALLQKAITSVGNNYSSQTKSDYDYIENNYEGDWKRAYWEFISEKQYNNYIDDIAEEGSYGPGYAIWDFEGDNIPELIMTNGPVSEAEATNHIFSFQNGKILYLGNAGFRHGLFLRMSDQDFRGLFWQNGNMGYYPAYYYFLENGQLKSEYVYLEETKWNSDEPSTSSITVQTNDEDLYQACREARDRLVMYMMEEISSIGGWDAFLSVYGYGDDFDNFDNLEANYYNLLDAFYYQILYGWPAGNNYSFMSYMFPMYTKDKSLYDIGYVFEDIDNNGIPELIVGSLFPDSFSLYDLYTFYNGSVIHLASSGERCWFSLGSKNNILYSGSGGAANHVWEEYSLNGNRLELVAMLIQDGFNNPDNPYFYGTINEFGEVYSTGVNGYSLILNHNDTKLSDDMISWKSLLSQITNSDAEYQLDKHEWRKNDLPLPKFHVLPFSEYSPISDYSTIDYSNLVLNNY